MGDAGETVCYSVEGGLATLILNRPNVLNAINRQMHEELTAALAASESNSQVRVIVIRGAGRAFSAGHDLKQDVAMPVTHPEDWRKALGETLALATQVWNSSKPVIASVHGYCLGKACQVALACDFVVAAEDAVFGEPEVKTVTSSAFPILPWLVGLRQAKKLMMLGRTVTGSQAMEMGMVTQSCPAADLEQVTRDLASELLAIPPAALRLNKRAINHCFEVMGLLTGAELNREMVSWAVARELELEGSSDFDRIRREQGLKAALIARDANAR